MTNTALQVPLIPTNKAIIAYTKASREYVHSTFYQIGQADVYLLGLYFVAGESSEQPKASPLTSLSGYLLWQDEKVRWRRVWCKAESRDMRFYIYEDNTEDVLLRSFSLENDTTHLECQVGDSEKDNCFLVSGVLYDAIGGNNGNEMEASTVPVDVYLAAYTESECKNWNSILQQLLSHDGVKITPVVDANSWSSTLLPQDSASSSSSNFSSNRDSMISNTSSLVNTFRVSSRSDLGEGKEMASLDDGRNLTLSKQQQPLPSPPQQIQVCTYIIMMDN